MLSTQTKAGLQVHHKHTHKKKTSSPVEYIYIYLVLVGKKKPTRVQEKQGDKYSIQGSLNQIIYPLKFYVSPKSKNRNSRYDYNWLSLIPCVRITGENNIGDLCTKKQV